MDYKSRIVDGQEVCFASEWIHDLEEESHFKWYYYQARIVYRNCSRRQKILEIGPGTGLLSDLLRRRGWDIRTLDIDEAKKPNYCQSALEFDYGEIEVDVVLAFEIFEHIPFATFGKVVDRIASSQVQSVYFSLPWNERTLVEMSLKVPKVPVLRWSWSIPLKKIRTRAHFWELSKRAKDFDGTQLVEVAKVREIFEARGYRLIMLVKVGRIQYFAAERM